MKALVALVLLPIGFSVVPALGAVVGDPETARRNYEQLGLPIPADLEGLITQGEELFFGEAFGGNGRTCGTCHPALNNLTIDPTFIATLPPTDPLFVAELDPKLAGLESPAMMREYGLILENLDGFRTPRRRFVLRSVPHLLSLGTSLASNRPGADNVGWGGDGAPAPGSLRAFATGAVRQHFTKSLGRVEGVDFRLPTEEELDALQAFLLSLGRTSDPDLGALQMLDEKAERGRVLFTTTDTAGGTQSAARCNLCHLNGGATSLLEPGVNLLVDTGVANDDKRPEGLPVDDGFGRGTGLFNPPPLIEAADTGPWFHANSRRTSLKEAIEFYDGDAFKNSPAATLLRSLDSGGLLFQGLEFDALEALLRVLNAVENIRAVSRFQERSKTHADPAALLALAVANLNDAIRVLNEGGLHADAVTRLQTALGATEEAQATTDPAARDALVDTALAEEQAARDLMVVGPVWQ
jgi:hypothetical protein